VLTSSISVSIVMAFRHYLDSPTITAALNRAGKTPARSVRSHHLNVERGKIAGDEGQISLTGSALRDL
jgi:hypothetical protein